MCQMNSNSGTGTVHQALELQRADVAGLISDHFLSPLITVYKEDENVVSWPEAFVTTDILTLQATEQTVWSEISYYPRHAGLTLMQRCAPLLQR